MAAKQILRSLSDLRNKTDRDLIVLAGREIERSRSLAARGAFAEAEALRRQVRTLLAIAPAAPRTRRHLEARLEQSGAGAFAREPLQAALVS